jgi:molecular chaperone HscB
VGEEHAAPFLQVSRRFVPPQINRASSRSGREACLCFEMRPAVRLAGSLRSGTSVGVAVFDRLPRHARPQMGSGAAERRRWRPLVTLNTTARRSVSAEASDDATSPLQCWSCDHTDQGPPEQINFFCGSCSTIQPPVERGTYFSMFDLPQRFVTDQRLLKDSFRRLQKLLHPDKFNQKTSKEQALSADQSASLNHAYNVLSKPHLRAIYLLKLHGLTLDEDVDDMELLMEVMETRERLEEAELDEVEEIAEKNAIRVRELEERLADEIDVKRDLEAAKATVVRLQYLMRIASTAEARLGRVL